MRPPPKKTPLSFRYDKLIIDDQVYIYNDSEKRIERLPFSVYSMAATGSISPEHTRGGGVGGSQINGKINGHQAIRGAAGAVSNAGLMAAGIPRRLTYSFFSMIGLCVQVCMSQVWSLTQFYSVDFSQSRNGVNKCVFYKRTIKVCVSCC